MKKLKPILIFQLSPEGGGGGAKSISFFERLPSPTI